MMYLRSTIEKRKSINRKTQLNEEVKPESKEEGGNNSEKHRVSKYQSLGRNTEKDLVLFVFTLLHYI